MSDNSQSGKSAPLLKMKRLDREPTGGWRYRTEDGYMVTAATWENLLLNATRYLSGNELPIAPNFPAIVENWLCHNVPQCFVRPVNGRVPTEPPLTWLTVRNATEAAIHRWKRGGSKTVTPAVALERAGVCSDCPRNAGAAACANCHGLVSWLRDYLRREPNIVPGLFACTASYSMNMLQVWFVPETINDLMTPVLRRRHPDNCWKLPLLRESDNG